MGSPIRMIVSIHCLTCLVACAGADPSTGSAEPTEGTTEVNTGQTQQELSNDPHCSSDPAEAVIIRNGSTSSPDNYVGGACASAHLVDIVNFAHGSRIPGSCSLVTPGTNGTPAAVIFEGPLPTNQADCEATRVIAYAWDTTASPPSYLGATQSFGSWVSSFGCLPATIYLNQTGIGPLTEGHNYRFAISARPGASSSSTSRVAMWEF